MSIFKASNGFAVERDKDSNVLVYSNAERIMFLQHGGAETSLREFFQHEKDLERGVWRWPAEPDYVVHPDPEHPGIVLVRHEPTGAAVAYDRADFPDSDTERWRSHRATAVAYFEAHPAPKPWHDARPGQIWALRTLDSMNGAREEAWQITDRRDEFWSLGLGYLPLTSRHIVGGRRIWPEDAS